MKERTKTTGTEARGLKVGEVRTRTGISVRTLHHYDAIGLLRPGRRTPSGHRLYGHVELERLQRIQSLKHLGFALEEIQACLDDPRFSLQRTLQLHSSRLDGRIKRMGELREQLLRLEARIAEDGEDKLTLDELLHTIEVTTMTEKYYTPEQLEQLKARRTDIGEEKIEQVQNHWLALAQRVNGAMAEGLTPTDDTVLALAREWRDLTRETVAGFTGGDPGIQESLGRVWTEEPNMGSQWGLGPEVRAYIGQAMAALKD